MSSLATSEKGKRMRSYRNFAAALALAFALLVPAYGDDGIMHTGIVAPTPTPAPISTTGIMHTGMTAEAAQVDGAESELTATGIITEITLELLRSALNLF
jgi:F0F1-type ATP synthase membrane subunit c/vacuolar-type H+-ATPase subunit K